MFLPVSSFFNFFSCGGVVVFDREKACVDDFTSIEFVGMDFVVLIGVVVDAVYEKY